MSSSKIASICRHAEALNLNEDEVKKIAGISARTDVIGMEGAIYVMLEEQGHDEAYVKDRISYEGYRKNRGHLNFSDWQATFKPFLAAMEDRIEAYDYIDLYYEIDERPDLEE